MNNRLDFAPALAVVLALGQGVSAVAQTATPPPPTAVSPATAPAVAATTTASAGPQITFSNKLYNFGKTSAGQMVRHDFIFTNTGSMPLEILDVKPQCGCTTAAAWDKRVEPGKTGVIPLQFNPTGFGGTVSKSATVTCNDPAQGTVHLQITGTVWKPIDVNPTMASFLFQGEDQTNQTKTVRIVNNTDVPLTLSDIKSSHASFQAELKTVTPGKEFDLMITALAPITNRSAYASISAKTSSTNMPQLNISAHITVQQQLTVLPETLYLPPGPLTNPVTVAVTVRNASTNAVHVSDAAVSVEGATVQVMELQAGRLFSLRATFPAGVNLKPGVPAEVTAKTDHPKYATLRVPITQSSLYSPPVASPFPTVTRTGTTNAFLAPRPLPGRKPLPTVPKE